MTDWKSAEAELNSKAIVAPQGLKRSRNVPVEAPKKLNDFQAMLALDDACSDRNVSAVVRLTDGHKDDVKNNEEVAKSALAVSRGDCDKAAGGNVVSGLFDRSQNVAIFDSLTSIVQSEKSTAQARKDALEALHNFSAEPDFRSICAEPKNLVTLNNINKMMATKDGGVLEADVVNQAKNLSAGILSEANEARKVISREDAELDKAVAEARKSEDPNKPVSKEVSNYYTFMTNPERDPLDRGEEYQKVRNEAKRYMDYEKERAKEEQGEKAQYSNYYDRSDSQERPAAQVEASKDTKAASNAKSAGGGGVMQGMSAEDRAAFAKASAGLSGVSMEKDPAKVKRAMGSSHAQDVVQSKAKPGARSIG